MTDDEWNPDGCDGGHGFVAAYGADVLSLLEPGDRILDVGCGTGHLTAEIADHGAEVGGIDAAESVTARARDVYPDLTVEVADAREYGPGTFDAVFSNAPLH